MKKEIVNFIEENSSFKPLENYTNVFYTGKHRGIFTEECGKEDINEANSLKELLLNKFEGIIVEVDTWNGYANIVIDELN